MGCGSAAEVKIFDQQPSNETIQDASTDSSLSHHPILHLKLPSTSPNDASSNTTECYFQQGFDGGNCLPLVSDNNILSNIYYCCSTLDAATPPSNDLDAGEGSDDGSSNDAGMKVKLDADTKTEIQDAATEGSSFPIIALEASADNSGDGSETSNSSDAGINEASDEANISDDGSFDDSSVVESSCN